MLKIKNENILEKTKKIKDFTFFLKISLSESIYVRQSLYIRFLIKNLTGVNNSL
jgi:hypothetical protein